MEGSQLADTTETRDSRAVRKKQPAVVLVPGSSLDRGLFPVACLGDSVGSDSDFGVPRRLSHREATASLGDESADRAGNNFAAAPLCPVHNQSLQPLGEVRAGEILVETREELLRRGLQKSDLCTVQNGHGPL